MAEVEQKLGRPPMERTQELTDQFFEYMLVPMSLPKIAKQPGMPSPTTVFKWLREDPAFAREYARVKSEQADVLVEQQIDIADDATNDWMERERQNGSTFIVFNDEAARRSQLRIATRQWLAAKLQPKKYGDKMKHEIGGEDGNPIKFESTPDQTTKAIEGKLASIAASLGTKRVPQEPNAE